MTIPAGRIQSRLWSRVSLVVVAVIMVSALIYGLYPSRKLEHRYHWVRTGETLTQGDQQGKALGVSQKQVLELLSGVIDPELGVSVTDLGLVYAVSAEGDSVKILMTLTTPSCPYGPDLINDIKHILFSHRSIREVEIRLTFDPPWSAENLSSAAREKIFGFARDTHTHPSEADRWSR